MLIINYICSNTERGIQILSRMAQSHVARIILFLKDKFGNHLLCNNLETIWHDWSVNMMESKTTFPVMPVSMTISTILPKKNYCKHVQNKLLGKTMDLWVVYFLKLILRSFLWIRDVAWSGWSAALLDTCISHEMKLQRILILGRIFKNLWKFQELLELSKHKNYQNNKNYQNCQNFQNSLNLEPFLNL